MLAAAIAVFFHVAALDPLVERLLSFPAAPPAAKGEPTTDDAVNDLVMKAAATPGRPAPADQKRVLELLASDAELLPQVVASLPNTPEAAETAWAAFGKIDDREAEQRVV